MSGAGVSADAAASIANQATIVHAGSGVPIVDIVAPTTKGVSHNKFNRFDIDGKGLVLNNSRAQVDTQLAGHIDANPNLAGGAARIILNEVTSHKRSQLNGLAEVAGSSAEFVLANPNGITCSGCGFINTPRATLVTGVPVLVDGDLQKVSIDGGDIAINSLNASGIDRLDLLSRAITLNEQLHAKRLNIVTGRNEIDYSTLAVTIKDEAGTENPAFALDVAALGGMYADQIFMVGTESGLGVNMQGEMASGSGDISIAADGTLTINKVISGRDLLLESGASGITVTGNTYSKGASALVATFGDVENRGNLIAEAGLSIDANNLFNTHTGNIQSFADASVELDGHFHNQTNGVKQGALTADDTLAISARNIVNNGVLGGGSSVILSAQHTLENSAHYSDAGAVLFAAGDLQLYGHTIVNRQSDILGLTSITMAGDASGKPAQLIRNSSATLESFGDLSVIANEFINHRQGIYNIDNDALCGLDDFWCRVPVADLGLDYGFSPADTIANAWLLEGVAEFAMLDWRTSGGWDDAQSDVRVAYQALVDKVLPSSRAADIIVGQDFNILAGNFSNSGGYISVVNDLSANVTTFYNASSLAVMPAPYGWAEHANGWLDKFDSDVWYGDYGLHQLFFEGAITAGNNLVVNAVEAINNGVSVSGGLVPAAPAIAPIPDLPLPSAPSSGNADFAITAQLNLAAVNPFVEFLDLPPGSDFDRIDVEIDLPASVGGSFPGGGLFHFNDPVTGQSNTLIATKPSVARFVDVQGSDYLLSILGFDPDYITKRLGDGFYESRLIRQAILNTTRNRFLYDSFASDAQQYRYLMESAARAAKDLQLAVGVALTGEQIQKLTHDMVWLEERQVNGESVLVPTLYLARIRADSFGRDGAAITANNVILNSGGDITNASGIGAKRDLMVHAADNVSNIGGDITGSNVVIIAEKGDFLHRRSGGKSAHLAARSNLQVTAGGDIRVLGSKIVSEGHGQLSAGRNLTIESTRAASDYTAEYFSQERNGVSSRHTEAEQRDDAQVLISGNASIASGKDFNISGAELSVGGNAIVDVGRNFNLESVTNRTTVETREKYLDIKQPERESNLARGYTTSLDSKKKIRSDVVTIERTDTEQASSFTVGGDLVFNSGGDVTISASRIAVEGNSAMAVGGELTLSSKDDHRETRSQIRDTYLRTSSPRSANAKAPISSVGNSAGVAINTTRSGVPAAGQLGTGIGLWDSSKVFTETVDQQSAAVLQSNRSVLEAGGDLGIVVGGNVRNRRSDVVGDDTAIVSGGAVSNLDTATISTGDLYIHAGGNFENTGNSSVTSGDITIDSGDSIINRGGTRIEGNNVSLRAKHDILNERTVTRNGKASANITAAELLSLKSGASGLGNITTTVSAESVIDADGDLLAVAGRDIRNTASRIDAGGQADLSSGRNIQLHAVADRQRVASRNNVADDIHHMAAEVSAANDLRLGADGAIEVYGSSLAAGGALTISAGANVDIQSVTDEHYRYRRKTSGNAFKKTVSITEIYNTTNVASELSAGEDITIASANENLILRGSNLNAGGAVNLAAADEVRLESAQEIDYSYRKKSSSGFGGLVSSSSTAMTRKLNQVGAHSKSAGDTAIVSSGDVNIVASAVDSDGDVDIIAGASAVGDINIVSRQERQESYYEKKKSGIGLKLDAKSISLGSKITEGKTRTRVTNTASELNAGGNARLLSGRDINVTGSALTATQNIALDAGRDSNLLAADEQDTKTHWRSESKLGVSWDSDSNGVNVFAGKETAKQRLTDDKLLTAGTLVKAGNDIAITGRRDIKQLGGVTDAGRDIRYVAGRNIELLADTETYTSIHTREQSKSGLGVSIQHNVGGATKSVQNLGQGDNPVSQVSSVLTAVDQVSQALSGPQVSASVGRSRSESTITSIQGVAQGSVVQSRRDIAFTAGESAVMQGTQAIAGGDLSVAARDITIEAAQNSLNQSVASHENWVGIRQQGRSIGVGASNGNSDTVSNNTFNQAASLRAGNNLAVVAQDDIAIRGSELSGGNLTLDAGNDLAIEAGEQILSERHRSRAGGGEIGLTAFEGGTLGIYVQGNASKNKLDRADISYRNSELQAVNALLLNSDGDTEVIGAHLNADHVEIEAHGDLTVASVQDAGSVSGKRRDISGRLTVGAGVSVSGSYGSGETEGTKHWVAQQTGVIGQESVNITAANHTRIEGALIANIDESGKDAGNLFLSTGSLAFNDIADSHQEQSDYTRVSIGWESEASAENSEQDRGSNSAYRQTTQLQNTDQTGTSFDNRTTFGVDGSYSTLDRAQINRATVGQGSIVVSADQQADVDSAKGLNRDIAIAHELTKDEGETTELYITESAVDGVTDIFKQAPDNTLSQWQRLAKEYGKNTTRRFVELGEMSEQFKSSDTYSAKVAEAVSKGMSESLNLLGKYTIGLMPSPDNHGGLTTQLPALVFGDQTNHVLKVDLERIIDEEGNERYQIKEKGLKYLGEDIDLSELPDDVGYAFVNGIQNSVEQAARNGATMTGTDKILIAYNPEHGLLADLIESGWDKTMGNIVPSGNGRQLAEMWAYFATNNIPMKGAAHSQGGLLTMVALQWMEQGVLNSFGNGEYQFQINGSPVSTGEFKETVERATRDDSDFKGHNINDGDLVPLLLGGNADNLSEVLGAILNIPKMLDPLKSPHSTYKCQGDFCDNKQPGIGQ